MADAPTFSRSRLAFALALICFANFLNYLDRQVVSALESVIRPAFGMSKPEFGTLWPAFTIGYMVFAPLVGYAAVRWRRNVIFAACVLVWSLATLGSGLADTKLELYISRFLIGVGEAGCLVIGPTLVVDLFSSAVRGRALSLFYLGMPLGGTAGYIVGGVVTQQAEKSTADVILFAGVHFMAETAKILNPSKTVLIPDLKAGCSLADSCPPIPFEAFKKQHPGHIVITYINCTAEIKVLSDIICTSSNAVQIVESLPADQKIIFAPDKNLGAYINKKSGRNMVLWDGACQVHEIFSLENEESKEVYRILIKLTEQLSVYAALLKAYFDIAGEFDFIYAKAKLAIAVGGNYPQLFDKAHIKLITLSMKASSITTPVHKST